MADFHLVLARVTEAISIQMQVINVMHILRATTEQREVSSVQLFDINVGSCREGANCV